MARVTATEPHAARLRMIQQMVAQAHGSSHDLIGWPRLVQRDKSGDASRRTADDIEFPVVPRQRG